MSFICFFLENIEEFVGSKILSNFKLSNSKGSKILSNPKTKSSKILNNPKTKSSKISSQNSF